MTKLFISHSSEDNEITEAVTTRLREQGYEAIFLDFDPVNGIPAGRDWEQEIYLQLKTCQALIVLLSPHSVESKWCFAEITLAKALGKQLFPIWVEECDLPAILSDTQAIDLNAEPERGYERLFTGLQQAGLDAQSSLHWNSTRPPYPGLESFQEPDAAVFFGRDQEIQDVLSALERRRRHGEPRVLLLIGASGSGKSSVVRAGILPRLKKLDYWDVLPPWRPGARPAERLNRVLDDLPQPHSDDFSDRIRLLTIDQLEEALAQDPSIDTFWTRLLSFVDEHGDSIQVLATLRSDFLRDLQNRPEIQKMDFEDILIGPMLKQRLPEVIEKPAARAGLELEDGLATRLVEDTSTEDALPLLAFTLRSLWERSQGPRLTLESYEAFGSLEGAVGRIADQMAGVSDLSEEETHAVKSAFLDLVRVNEDGNFFRQRAAWDQLPEAARPVLKRLVQTRLLTRDEDQLEVTHEALFRTWPQLAGWLNEEREFLLWRRRFRHNLREWQCLDKDAGALLRGGGLAEAERWAAEKPTKVNPQDRQYLTASRQVAAKQEQRERRRFKIAVGAAMALLALAGVAFWQWQVSVEQRKVAEARQLAATAETGLSSTTPVLNRATLTDYQPTFGMGVPIATAKVLESLVIAPTPEGFRAWLRVMQALPVHPPEIIVASSGLETFAFSPDGDTVVLSRHAPPGDPEIIVVDVSTREILKRFPTNELAYQLAVSPDGSFLVAGFVDTLEARRMDDGVVMQRWPQPRHPSVPPQIADKPSQLKRWRQPEDQNLEFSPDGRWLAIAGRSGVVILRTVDWEEQILEELDRGSSPTFSSDGRWFALHGFHRLRVWETATGRLLSSQLRAGSPAGLVFCSNLLYDVNAQGVLNVLVLEKRKHKVVLWNRQSQHLPFHIDKMALTCEHFKENQLRIKVLLKPSLVRSTEMFSYEMLGLRPIATLPQLPPARRIDFHPGRDAVVTLGPQSLQLWPTPRSSPLSAEITVPDQRIDGLSFDPESDRLIARTDNEDIIVIETGAWKHVDSDKSITRELLAKTKRLEKEVDRYMPVTSPDGRWQFQSETGTLRSEETSTEILSLRPRNSEELLYDFSPDGKWLAFVADQETIQVLPLHEQEWLRLLCERSRYLFPYELGSFQVEQPAICKDLLGEDDQG